jgi:hypothetical protein
MISTSPVEQYDRATITALHGVQPNAVSVVPEFLHHGLLAHLCMGEICRKRKNPAAEDAGLSWLRSFGFGN